MILHENMGQKFSNLKGLLVTMVGEEETEGKESREDEAASTTTTSSNDGIKSDKLRQVCNAAESASLNGNDVGKEHFESIYSNSSESSVRTGELNGSVLQQQQQQQQLLPHTSQCEGGRQPCACSTKTKAKSNKSRKGSDEGHGTAMKRNSLRTMSFVWKRRSRGKSARTKDGIGDNVKKRGAWVLKFNCAKLKPGFHGSSSSFVESDIPQPNIVCDSCVCTGYRRTEEHHLGAGVVFEANASGGEAANGAPRRKSCPALTSGKVEEPARSNPVIDLSKFNPEDFPIEDCDERARLERAREIAEGVEPPPGFQPGQHIQLVCPPEITLDSVVSKHLTMLFQTHLGLQTAAALSALSQIDVNLLPAVQRMVHTQVDYIHCLVPDLLQITLSSFYWGKMDRFEAERLLEGRPDGTFLLRDSSQEEFIFSVTFRRYGRSLHARIEQWNHMFSFDCHDPGVFSSPTVCGLLEHYKDPSCCMYFEPMLAIPLHRNFPFPLQHLCRATVCSLTKYDSINQLYLPRAIKSYLKEYHYKQRVRVRRFDSEF